MTSVGQASNPRHPRSIFSAGVAQRKKSHPYSGVAPNVNQHLFQCPAQVAGEHFICVEAVAISTHLLPHLLRSQFGSQFAGSQFLSHFFPWHSVFAFFRAFFLPPSFEAAKAEPDISAMTNMLKNIFFIFKY
jgi:hypothetical protein